MKIIKKMVCLLFIGFLCSTASAKIYKCEKASGTIFYNDKPCPISDKESEFESVKDPKNGYVPSYTTDAKLKSKGDQVDNNKLNATSTSEAIDDNLQNKDIPTTGELGANTPQSVGSQKSEENKTLFEKKFDQRINEVAAAYNKLPKDQQPKDGQPVVLGEEGYPMMPDANQGQ